MPDANIILEMNSISKSFGGTVALSDVTLHVKSGSILALLGENGAGKSTLIKILAGIYRKDSGYIKYKDEIIEDSTALKGKNAHAISFIHQDLGLIHWMTVSENIGLSTGFPKKSGIFIDWRAMERRAQQTLNILGVDINPNERIMNLSRAEQSLIAISRAIAEDSNVIVLDEPTASLASHDVEKLFTVLKTLKANNVALILVSHRLDEIFAVCDDVFIVRDGKTVGKHEVCTINEKELVQLIVGKDKDTEDYKDSTSHNRHNNQTPYMSIESIVTGDIGPVSFTVAKGEIVALSGLRGAGQENIARVLSGVEQKTSGHIFLQGEPYEASTPQKAIEQGISLLARDRIHESICESMTVSENMFLNPHNHGYSFLYSVRNESMKTSEKIVEYHIKSHNMHLEINSLSGGNQQKVVLARWFDINTPILILEDPTQGVDIGSRVEIYKYIRAIAAEKECTVIVVSTDFKEITALAHRAFVFSKGTIVQELVGEDITVSNLLYYASAWENQ